MKKLLVLGALTLLAGCTAGMKDSFDCNATAQDCCMTMEEANQRASAQTSPLGKSLTLGGTTQKRAELPRLAPLATPIVPITTTASTRQVQPVETKSPVAQASVSSSGAFAHSQPPVKKLPLPCLSSLTPQHRGGLGGILAWRHLNDYRHQRPVYGSLRGLMSTIIYINLPWCPLSSKTVSGGRSNHERKTQFTG